MPPSKYLSSETSEHLSRSVFDGVDVPRIYDELGLEYEQYILEDAGRAKAIQWVITELVSPKRVSGEALYVVDLGCASGRPTVETIARALQNDANDDAENKHAVIGVDVSTVQLTLARDRIATTNPIARFEQGDMRTWSPSLSPSGGKNDGVDAVLSFYALNHLPLDDYRQVVQRMAGWLRPGGALALGTVAHVNGPVKWLGYDVVATSLPLDEVRALVERAGCRVREAWEEDWHSATRAEAKAKLNQFVLAVKD